MNVSVIKSFRDRYTRKINKAGMLMEMEDARFIEVNAADGGPFVVEIKDEKGALDADGDKSPSDGQEAKDDKKPSDGQAIKDDKKPPDGREIKDEKKPSEKKE